MEIKTFRAASMQEALRLVRRELGPEAAVLRTREVRAGGMLGLLTGERGIEVEASAEVIVPSRLPKRPAILDQGIDLSEMALLERSVNHELHDERVPHDQQTTPWHIVIAGATAGAGATTVAAQLAAALNRSQLRTLVWNSDHPFEHFTQRGVQSPAAAEVLLFDVGCDASEKFDRLWAVANVALLVVTPESKSILDGYAAIKQLAERHPQLKIQIIVNFARDAFEADRVYSHLSQTCRQFLHLEVAAAGYVSRLSGSSASIHPETSFSPTRLADGVNVAAKQFEQIASRIAIDSPIHYLRSVSKKNLKFAESAVTAGRY